MLYIFYFFMLCVADPSWSLYLLLLLYHAWPTLRGRWTLTTTYHAITRPVNFMLPFNTCISLDI